MPGSSLSCKLLDHNNSEKKGWVLKRTGDKIDFEKDDAVSLKQIALTAMTIKSKASGGKAVTSFPKDKYGVTSGANLFFSHLHKMTFDISTRRFEVAGDPSRFRNRYITRKVIAGVNDEVSAAEAKAQELAIEKASEVMSKKAAEAGVDGLIEVYARTSNLQADDIHLLKNKIVPIMIIALTG